MKWQFDNSGIYFIISDGLFYIAETSEVEKEDVEDAGKWFNYLMFEFAIRLP
jgi:hypothetical protein